MNIGMRIHQDVGVSQQLNLAPQLLQWLRLLHVPTAELSALVQHELETNPALETDERFAGSDTAEDGLAAEHEVLGECDRVEQESFEEKQEFLLQLDAEWGEDRAASQMSGGGAEEQGRHSFLMDSAVADVSLYRHLLDQLPLSGLDEADWPLAELVIGSLDERGYLSMTAEELARMGETDLARATLAIASVQAMDPAGVGARDLSACLMLQMSDAKPGFLPRQIAERYLEAVGRGQMTEIGRALGVTEEDVRKAVSYLTALDPAPGERFSRKAPEYVEADVTVTCENGTWRIDLDDDALPRLRISASCRRLLEKPTLTPAEAAYVRAKIRSAAFLIEGIGQRQETLRKVAEQIVRFQREYLASERGELKPLTMAKLAAMIGVHETTVSRALANKHIRTPRGLFEMKHFFRSGYACADGSFVTPDKVKSFIRNIVGDEPPLAPPRDTDIVAQLRKHGLRVARRTVAKYREEMGIPSSKERKKFAKRASVTLPFRRVHGESSVTACRTAAVA